MQSLEVPRIYRPDCAERYESIKAVCDFKGKSLVDIGCATGYFAVRFLNDGGASVVGVEPDTQYNENFIVRDIKDVIGIFDLCFYLDLHYHNEINYLPWIASHARMAFIAASGVDNNQRLQEELFQIFGNFEFVSKSSYAQRSIYKVVNELP
jgi:hypothetical protein